MDHPQTSTDSSADPSGPESTAGVESKNQLQMFVTVVTVRVLNKCRALEKHEQEEWVGHINRLVDRTTDGLAVT